MFIRAARDFSELSGVDIGNAKLVTIDAENVLTAYGDPEIRPEAMAMLEKLRCHKNPLLLAVATNNKDPQFLLGLEQQLDPSIPIFAANEFANKKTSPDMFLAAAEYMNIDPLEAIHIDDQLLSFRGARMAQFAGGILVKPFGSNLHIGVRVGRVLDNSVRRVLSIKQSVSDISASGIDY